MCCGFPLLMPSTLLINANVTMAFSTAFSLQAPLSIITAAGSLLGLPSCMDANMTVGLPSHANLGSCSNAFLRIMLTATELAQRKVSGWFMIGEAILGPDDCLQGEG